MKVFMTGSRVYGTNKSDSDYDFVVMNDVINNVRHDLEENGFIPMIEGEEADDCDYAPEYHEKDGIRVNLIEVKNYSELGSWMHATWAVDNLIKSTKRTIPHSEYLPVFKGALKQYVDDIHNMCGTTIINKMTRFSVKLIKQPNHLDL